MWCTIDRVKKFRTWFLQDMLLPILNIQDMVLLSLNMQDMVLPNVCGQSSLVLNSSFGGSMFIGVRDNRLFTKRL